jgi:hypothetical protein
LRLSNEKEQQGRQQQQQWGKQQGYVSAYVLQRMN